MQLKGFAIKYYISGENCSFFKRGHSTYMNTISMQRLSLLILLIFLGVGKVNSADIQLHDLSADAKISMITILPGDATEELFGHSAIRVYDPQLNLDIIYNYGTFQFDQYFLPKFIYGELNYHLSVVRTSLALNYYKERGRPVIEQVLNFSPQQNREIYEFLRINSQEENRYYRYDFLFDNCSTRISDLLENVLGEDVRFKAEPDPGLTFREMIELYVDHKPGIDLGINLLLGREIDRVVTPRESWFLPDFLMEAFNHAIIIVDGEEQPLVGSTSTILNIEEYKKENTLPWASIFTWMIFLVGVAITVKNFNKNQVSERWFDLLLFGTTGFIGLLISFLWFISLHEVTVNNMHLFWAWPFHLIALPFLYQGKKLAKPINIYFLLYAISCLIILVGWLEWSQSLHVSIIPVLLLLIIRSLWFSVKK